MAKIGGTVPFTMICLFSLSAGVKSAISMEEEPDSFDPSANHDTLYNQVMLDRLGMESHRMTAAADNRRQTVLPRTFE
jgi:hypothetical protein